jgi:acyl-CoA synthetase (AMP-forming)/AMP-acid ligase II
VKTSTPREIEDVLYTHPGIANVAVVGVPDPEWGEIVVAFVQLRPDQDLSGDELSAFCRERLASYKAPRIWRFGRAVSPDRVRQNPKVCAARRLSRFNEATLMRPRLRT